VVYLSGARCRFAYGSCHCHSLYLAPVNPDCVFFPVFTFLAPAHPGSPRHSPGGRKMVVVVEVVAVVVVVLNVVNSCFFLNLNEAGLQLQNILKKWIMSWISPGILESN